MEQTRNPYGKRPGGGISLPDYYRPTKSIKNRNAYMPGTEIMGPDEMRILFVGSTPWPPTRSQSGTSILVELGTGEQEPRRFIFDLGNGSVKNILAMQVPTALINDIFISHLHVDHYADLPYLYPFSAWGGRWFTPLRVYGPSGSTPELGTKYMIEQMKKMLIWHLENFDHCAIGDGYEIDVTEFDWKDENGLCYDEEGVTVRHWPRSHVKDGASAYRLDWEEADLSFVWSGDGRPDSKTVKYSKNVDVFVSEGQLETPWIQSLKFGLPAEVARYTLDSYHTPYYAAGLMMKEIQPRIGMITHIEQTHELMSEAIAEVRCHWNGLFILGYPDVMVVNVTKDSIWARMAAIPEAASLRMPHPKALLPKELAGKKLPEKIKFPTPRRPRETQQEQFLRDMEISPDKYYPEDVTPEIFNIWPKEGISLDVAKLIKAQKGKTEEEKETKEE